MKRRQREIIIENALNEYGSAKQSGDQRRIDRAVNGMENVYICVCLWGDKGSETLRQTILAAKEM